MPPKIRKLEKQLMKAGFIYGIVVISGKASRDARPYQINMVRDAISLVKK